MDTRVSLDDLLAAFEWVSGGEVAGLECNAYVSRATGKIHWCGEGVDEEPPEDIEDESVYVAVPPKSEFDLGRSLALRFIEERLPRSYDTVHEYFRKRGAFSRFKALLAHSNQLEAWYQYEQAAVEEVLGDWCAENGLTLAR